MAAYRIIYTSTLFFQDDHSLIVVGASKFEIIIDMQTIKRQIIIDGIMIHKNCQRTLDVSLPMTCHCPTSSRLLMINYVIEKNSFVKYEL
jgi:hypothetical protein